MEVERLKTAVRGIRAPEAVQARVLRAARREAAPARRRGMKTVRGAERNGRRKIRRPVPLFLINSEWSRRPR